MNVIKKILSLIAGAVLVSSATLYAEQVPASSKGKVQGKQEFIVVIDAGHGGNDVGAADNGIREKDVNLGVAKRLAEMLGKKRKAVKVVMTRDKDEFISLQERANIANRNHGDLFISIHTNSVDKKNSNRKKVRGSSVYALGLHKDADNLRVAQRENSVIEYEKNYEQKYSGFDPKKDESYIIFEMAQKRNLGHSLKFAGEAQKQLVSVADRADRGVKQAGFWVLWATSMPAVLVELDFICNPNSAKFIGSSNGQQKMAEALFNAIENYEATVNAGSKNRKVNEPKDSGKKKNDDNRKKRKVKKEDVAEDQPAVPAAATVANEPAPDGVPVLASSYTVTRDRKVSDSGQKTSRQEERSYNFAARRTGNGSLPVGQRKRRSANGRRASDNRDMTGSSIKLRSETELLAKIEEKKVDPVAPVVIQQDPIDSKNNKDKKNKNKKVKDNKIDSKKLKDSNSVKKTDGKVTAKSNNGRNKKDDAVTANANNVKKTTTGKKTKRHTSLAGRRNRDKKS